MPRQIILNIKLHLSILKYQRRSNIKRTGISYFFLVDFALAAFAFIGILFDDLHPAALSILADDVHLVTGRVLLVLGGHADVGGGKDGLR